MIKGKPKEVTKITDLTKFSWFTYFQYYSSDKCVLVAISNFFEN